jgi:hypothetical protein
MTNHERARKRTADKPPPTFEECVTKYGFRKPAVGVQSAEAWHEVYAWHDIRQNDAVRGLSPSTWPFPLGVCSQLEGGCTRARSCPTVGVVQPRIDARSSTSVSRLVPRRSGEDGR